MSTKLDLLLLGRIIDDLRQSRTHLNSAAGSPIIPQFGQRFTELRHLINGLERDIKIAVVGIDEYEKSVS